jgi:hypothetical protein
MTDLRTLVAQVDALGSSVSCAVGRGSSGAAGIWTTPAELAAGEGDALEELMRAYGRSWGVPDDRRSQASFVILDYTWYLAAPLVASHLLAGRLPSVRGASVRLDAASRTGTLALAAEPPRTSSPELLGDEVIGHLRPLVERVADRRWLEARAAWLGVGDRIVGAFEHVGDLIGQRTRAQADAAALVHRPGSELDSPRHRFATYEHRGVERTVGIRASCCRFYRAPAARYCLTCPLVTEHERTQRVRDWIAGELPQRSTQGDP